MLKKILIALFALTIMHSNIALASNTYEENNMNRTEICKDNYRTLFKGEALPTEGNDAEMLQILQKYIFGEVFTIGNLDIKIREMITVVSLTTMQTLPQLKAHINGALNAGNSPIELREAIYQCAPFIGFPKTLNALAVLNEVLKERGIEAPAKKNNISEEERFSKGREIQYPIYGDEIKESLQDIPYGENAAKFLTEVCFGDFYTRKELDLKTRALLTIAILVTTGNTTTLKSHILGNIKVGNDKETIAAVIIQCMPYVGFPNAIQALKTLKEVL